MGRKDSSPESRAQRTKVSEHVFLWFKSAPTHPPFAALSSLPLASLAKAGPKAVLTPSGGSSARALRARKIAALPGPPDRSRRECFSTGCVL